MKACKTFREEYIKNGLEGLHPESIEHASSCEQCGELMEGMSMMKSTGNAASDIKMPQNLKMDILSGIPVYTPKLQSLILDGLTFIIFVLIAGFNIDKLINLFVTIVQTVKLVEFSVPSTIASLPALPVLLLVPFAVLLSFVGAAGLKKII